MREMIEISDNKFYQVRLLINESKDVKKHARLSIKVKKMIGKKRVNIYNNVQEIQEKIKVTETEFTKTRIVKEKVVIK